MPARPHPLLLGSAEVKDGKVDSLNQVDGKLMGGLFDTRHVAEYVLPS